MKVLMLTCNVSTPLRDNPASVNMKWYSIVFLFVLGTTRLSLVEAQSMHA